MQKHTQQSAGWKYTVSALALSFAMAPVAQAASVLQSTGKLELKGAVTKETGPVTKAGLDTGPVKSVEPVATKMKALAGREFTFEKWVDAKGNVTTVILDEKGNEVSERALPRISQNILEPELEQLLRTRRGRSGVHKVNVALELALTVPSETTQTGTAATSDSGESQLQINGRKVSEKDIARLQAAERQARGENAARRVQERLQLLAAFAKRHNIDLPREAFASLTNTLTLKLTAEQIEDLVDSNDSTIIGIELYEEGQDDLSSAMIATGTDPWALSYASTRGDGIGIYMTESGCANDSRFSEYTRLDGSETDHSRNVGGIIKGVAPEAHLYCRGDAVLPTSTDLYGSWLPDWILDFLGISRVDLPIQVVTRSHSTNDTTAYDTNDRDWDDFTYDHEIPTFNSGGNTGLGTGNVRSPGKGLNVATIGNYSDSTNAINSQSPSVDPDTGNDKPEISAPGTSVTAGGFTKSGTSMSTPHAAAFTADSLSSYSWLQYKPHLAKAKQLAGATDEIAGGADAVGLGGIDFLSSQYSGHNYWMHGSNSSFSSLDGGDGSTDGYITRQVYISSSYDAVRIAMTWLSRGTYVYSHRSDAHPIGIDFDVRVYDPSGVYLGGSYSWDNGWEDFDFEPTVSGYYTFKINRYANRDSSNKIRLGVAVNVYDY